MSHVFMFSVCVPSSASDWRKETMLDTTVCDLMQTLGMNAECHDKGKLLQQHMGELSPQSTALTGISRTPTRRHADTPTDLRDLR